MPAAIAIIGIAVAVGSAVYQGVASSNAADDAEKARQAQLELQKQALAQQGIVDLAQKRLLDAQFDKLTSGRELFGSGTDVQSGTVSTPAATTTQQPTDPIPMLAMLLFAGAGYAVLKRH